MKLSKQLFRHKPAEGVFGDCYRTAIACILGLKPVTVPHEQRQLTGDEFQALYLSWLHRRGLRRINIPMLADDLQAALNAANFYSDGLPYIFSGTSRTGVNHSVVGQGPAIIHDPSLTNAGIIGPCDDGYYWVEFLVRTAEGRKPDRASAGQAAPPEGQPPAGGDAAREA